MCGLSDTILHRKAIPLGKHLPCGQQRFSVGQPSSDFLRTAWWGLNSTPWPYQSLSLMPSWHDSLSPKLSPTGLKAASASSNWKTTPLLTASPHLPGSNVTVASSHFPEAGRKQSEGQPKVDCPCQRVWGEQGKCALSTSKVLHLW